jgi:oligopeptide transport system substrate-binding protein
MLLLAKCISLSTFHVIKLYFSCNCVKRAFHHFIWLGLVHIFLGGCSAPSNVENAIEDKILHFGLGSEPQYLDPHLASSVSANNVITALIEGLVSEDPKTLQPLPGVAERWDVSKDGLLYTFHLRKNAKWSNGDPVTAHDFVYSYRTDS